MTTTEIVRVTRVDYDADEEPATLHFAMSKKALTAVREHAQAPWATPQARTDGLFHVVMAMADAADIARHFGNLRGAATGQAAFYYCVDGLCNRWWDGGLDDAPTAAGSDTEPTDRASRAEAVAAVARVRALAESAALGGPITRGVRLLTPADVLAALDPSTVQISER